MPIYEYVCDRCNKSFEKLESIRSDSHETECPQCGGSARRKISATSYLLKGSGFHNTDYKRKPAAECSKPGKESCCASCPNAQPK